MGRKGHIAIWTAFVKSLGRHFFFFSPHVLEVWQKTFKKRRRIMWNDRKVMAGQNNKEGRRTDQNFLPEMSNSVMVYNKQYIMTKVRTPVRAKQQKLLGVAGRTKHTNVRTHNEVRCTARLLRTRVAFLASM